MATPLVKVLRKQYPTATIDVACMMGGVKYIYKNNPNINNVYFLSIYKGTTWNGMKQLLVLRNSHYDISILSFPSYRREYHIVHAFIGAKKRIAHSFSTGHWLEFNFLNTELVAVDETSHNVINNLNLLYALGVNWEKIVNREQITYDLLLDKSDIQFGKEYIYNLGWQKNMIVGIHPGSTNSPAALLRRWPIDRYSEVVKFLVKNGVKVLVFIGPEETELGNDFKKWIRDEDYHLVKNIKFNQSLGVLNQVHVLICNDNGFGHLANALGKKIVTLWASTNDKWSLPYNKRIVTLIRPPDFNPWYNYVLKRAIPMGMRGGMEKIQVNEVIKAVAKVI